MPGIIRPDHFDAFATLGLEFLPEMIPWSRCWERPMRRGSWEFAQVDLGCLPQLGLAPLAAEPDVLPLHDHLHGSPHRAQGFAGDRAERLRSGRGLVGRPRATAGAEVAGGEARVQARFG